jgi:glyceraldehyde 3-phosphate dehydrogenase
MGIRSLNLTTFKHLTQKNKLTKKMQKTRTTINGFKNIEMFFRLLNHPTIEVITLMTLLIQKTMSHLIKYDSIHGVLKEKCLTLSNSIVINAEINLFVI